MLNDNETDVDLSQYEMVFDNIIQIDELLDNADFNKFVQFVKLEILRTMKKYMK